ncbi:MULTISPECIES: hypothetical protein [unclassified Pseudoclavibacter]|uniref:hypothetical protein n=1 Tax=unclassified Pseudoclavibacter TaxID=2615177 RepID=UPI0011B095DB|nr:MULTISPECIES: hypothetical protein [unclassified Pseudoclavibacter]
MEAEQVPDLSTGRGSTTREKSGDLKLSVRECPWDSPILTGCTTRCGVDVLDESLPRRVFPAGHEACSFLFQPPRHGARLGVDEYADLGAEAKDRARFQYDRHVIYELCRDDHQVGI